MLYEVSANGNVFERWFLSGEEKGGRDNLLDTKTLCSDKRHLKYDVQLFIGDKNRI